MFNVYKSWRVPQERTEKADIILQSDVKALRERLDAEQRERLNHLHTLDLKMDETNKAVQDLAKELVRLNTILEERLPKKLHQ
jgi:hypothetical protein